NQMRSVVSQSTEAFYMAKVRTLGMYNSGRNQLTRDIIDPLAKGNQRDQHAAQSGRALQAMQDKRFAEARQQREPL
ncbi:hypothetical protein CDT91_21715, partial [Cronobacter sakazakii]